MTTTNEGAITTGVFRLPDGKFVSGMEYNLHLLESERVKRATQILKSANKQNARISKVESKTSAYRSQSGRGRSSEGKVIYGVHLPCIRRRREMRNIHNEPGKYGIPDGRRFTPPLPVNMVAFIKRQVKTSAFGHMSVNPEYKRTPSASTKYGE